MELWDILDAGGKPTGRTIERGQTLNKGEYHLVVHVWIVNSSGEFLIQRRADHLKLLPGIWAAAGGSALAGEDSLTAAIRELREEMNLDLLPSQLTWLFRTTKAVNIYDVWLARADIPISRIRVQRDEVVEAAWAGKEEIQVCIARGTFFDYGSAYMEKLFRLTGDFLAADL